MQDVRLLSLYWAVVWVCSLSCYSWRIPSELFGAYRDRSVHPAVNDQIKIQRFVFSIFFFSCNLFFQQSSKVSGGIFQVFLLQQFAKNNFECRVKVTFGKKMVVEIMFLIFLESYCLRFLGRETFNVEFVLHGACSVI